MVIAGETKAGYAFVEDSLHLAPQINHYGKLFGSRSRRESHCLSSRETCYLWSSDVSAVVSRARAGLREGSQRMNPLGHPE